MKSSTLYLALWLSATLVAVLMALNMNSAAYVDGNYIPVGNDSFYHARRILDFAVGERGFYQFDNMIHAPEGSWLTWPWAYDYLMGIGLSVALWINPAMEPMAFLAHVPVVWLLINMGLLTLIGWQTGLRPVFAGVMLFGFALLPLTQTLHGVGIIDHHFIELSFVLATVLFGLRLFAPVSKLSDAIMFGLVLGLAPAFHNSLFVLQIPLLLSLFIWWLRGATPATRTVQTFAAALFVSSLLIVIPSEPFRDMQFEFWTLSWFHLYIASCTTVCTLFMGMRPYAAKNLAILLALGVLLGIPLLAKIAVGAQFISGDLAILNQITEVKSPFSRLANPGGLIWVSSFYSWLLFAAPVLIAAFAWRGWQAREGKEIYLSVMVVFGLLMLLMQFRFHPFGSWALFLGCLLLAQEFCDRKNIAPKFSGTVAVVALLIALQPPIKNRLFLRYAPGNTVDYAATRTLFPSFAAACAENAGTAISYNDDGHYIRYHTDCSVLSNNFLLTPLHEKKVIEVDQLLRLDPEQFLRAAPHIDYVFTRMYEIFERDESGVQQPTSIPDVVSRNAPLFVALTFASELPPEYVLVDEVRVDDERDFAYARVFRIVRD